jgi:hypothetical protein
MDDVRAHRRECEVVGSVESAAVGKIAQAMRGPRRRVLLDILPRPAVGWGWHGAEQDRAEGAFFCFGKGCWGAIPNKTTNSYVIEISMLN